MARNFLLRFAAMGLALGGVLLSACTSSSRAATPSFDCARASDWVEVLICKSDLLAEADRQMSEAYKLEIAEEKNPQYASTDREFQLDWIKNRGAACGGRAPGNADEERSCAASLRRAMNDRTFSLLRGTSRSKETYAHEEGISSKLKLPSNWWGWALPTADPLIKIERLYVGENGDIFVRWRLFDPNSKRYEFAIVSATNGIEIASTQKNPEVSKNVSLEQFMIAQLGLQPVSMPFPGKEPISVEQKGRCDRPNQFLIGDAFYLYEHFSFPKVFPEDDTDCENMDHDSKPVELRTYDFQSLYLSPNARLPDGTILATANERWVIRFKPDLSSPFFNGQSSLVRVEARKIDAIVDEFYEKRKTGFTYKDVISRVQNEISNAIDAQEKLPRP